jgi:hypothetical protein
MAEPVPPNPEASSEITLEEWIASCQSCCGVEPESWFEVPTPDYSIGDSGEMCKKTSGNHESGENSQ